MADQWRVALMGRVALEPTLGAVGTGRRVVLCSAAFTVCSWQCQLLFVNNNAVRAACRRTSRTTWSRSWGCCSVWTRRRSPDILLAWVPDTCFSDRYIPVIISLNINHGNYRVSAKSNPCDCCWYFTWLLNNKIYTFQPSFVKIYQKWQNSCCFNPDYSPFLSTLSALSSPVCWWLWKEPVCWWWDEDADLRWTELLQMPNVTTVGSHSHVGSQALGEVRHRLVDVFLWQLLSDGLHSEFQSS